MAQPRSIPGAGETPDRGSTAIPEAGPVLSNRLTVLAAEARASFGDYRRDSRASGEAYVATGARLLEARKTAKRGQWGPWLAAAGIEERTARNLLAIARGGWTGEALADAGGVAAALRVQAWRERLADGAPVSAPAEALEALRAGPDSFVAYCEARDEAPADVVAGFTIPKGEAEAVSGNAGAGKWNPARPSLNEWYSPAWIVEPAREVLGRFDLDPASCEAANETIKAGRYFTAEDDGLAQPWEGRIWMNPPYSDRDLIRWVTKLVESMDSGDVPEAVMLLPAYVETRMGQAALARCEAVCFPSKRVQFERPGLPTTNPPAGSMVAYFGPKAGRFREAYSDRGIVLPGLAGWAPEAM